jgi:hypothetical protein
MDKTKPYDNLQSKIEEDECHRRQMEDRKDKYHTLETEYIEKRTIESPKESVEQEENPKDRTSGFFTFEKHQKAKIKVSRAEPTFSEKNEEK